MSAKRHLQFYSQTALLQLFFFFPLRTDCIPFEMGGTLERRGGKTPRRRAKIKRPCRPVTRLRETCPRARMQRIVPAGHSVRSGVASSPRGPQTFLKKSLILNDQTGFAASFFLKKKSSGKVRKYKNKIKPLFL